MSVCPTTLVLRCRSNRITRSRIRCHALATGQHGCHKPLASAAFIRNEPPPEVDDAHWLLDFYATFVDYATSSDITDIALERLAQVGQADR